MRGHEESEKLRRVLKSSELKSYKILGNIIFIKNPGNKIRTKEIVAN